MKIKPKIRTAKEIDQIVAGFSGTWVRRRNAREKLILWSNELLNEEIELQRTQIRALRAQGCKDGDLRCHFAEITKLEIMKIDD
ncbi:coil containing protein [Vibrio phage 1.240.O._10N.261.52.F8]|nr:coil containing protein [Vibrio phage 1.240.O._10N.261.52.F8]